MPKTPVTYYGGKQSMIQHIIPNIPEHHTYTETFFGGGAIFFAKDESPNEVINDLNSHVINFYEVCRTNFAELKQKIESTLFSRATYKVAMVIYQMPHLFNAIQKAWAFYVATNMGFGCAIGSWALDKYGKRAKSFWNKKLLFDESIPKRLEKTHIECNDAIKVLKQYDAEDAFHFIDPPYINTDMGHYSHYSEDDYIRLLDCLTELKGKFMLCGFPNDILDTYLQQNPHWHIKRYDKVKSAVKAEKGQKRTARKIEVLVANYPLV